VVLNKKMWKMAKNEGQNERDDAKFVYERRICNNAIGNNAIGNNAMGNNAIGNNAIGIRTTSLAYEQRDLHTTSRLSSPLQSAFCHQKNENIENS